MFYVFSVFLIVLKLMYCRVSELFVDSPDGAERIPVRLNITLPKMSCDCKCCIAV